jgi:hypothetical protein
MKFIRRGRIVICHSGKIAALGILLLALTACATTLTKGYAGPALSGDQTALVESGPYTRIVKYDGMKLSSQNVAVLPGEHTVEMRLEEAEQPNWEYFFYSGATGSVTFTAEPGHRYLVYINIVPAPGLADEERGSGYTWVGCIQDRSTGKKIASTSPLPLEADPRLVAPAAP